MSQRISLNQIQTSERFYRIPKVFTDKNSYYFKLSTDSKFLYSILKDRFELSIQNKWIDKEGNVFMYFTIAELSDILGYSQNKIAKLKKELRDFGLLEEERQGLNKPNRLYILNINAYKTSDTKDTQNLRIQNLKNSESRNAKFEYQEPQNLRTNDTEYNDTEISETDNKIIDEEEKIEKKKSEIISDFGKSIGKSLISEAELNTENNLRDITYFNQYFSKALDNVVEKYKKFNSKTEDYFYIPMEGF